MDALELGVDASEPGVRRRIGGAPQESHDHHISHRLTVRKIGMDPEAVSSLEVGDLCDRERLTGALNTHINLRPY